MCSGTLANPRDWNHELHNVVGCDHDSPLARKLDIFLNDFVMFRHYNRRASDPVPAEPIAATSDPTPTPQIDSGYATKPLAPFTVTRRMREDAAKEPRGETITFGPASPIKFPVVGCHNPNPFLGHEQEVPKVDFEGVKRVMDFARGGIVNTPQTTFGGFPVAAPIDLPPVKVLPRFHDIIESSIRRKWRMK